MAKITDCPKGHRLQVWIAKAGICDGCGRHVFHGEKVMDCRECNWYLCDDCSPQGLADYSMWTAVSSMFSGLTMQCVEVQPQHRPGRSEDEEIFVEPRRRTRSRPSSEPSKAPPQEGTAPSKSCPKKEEASAPAKEAPAKQAPAKEAPAKEAPAKEAAKAPPAPVVDLLDFQGPQVPLLDLSEPAPAALDAKAQEGLRCTPAPATKHLGGA
mmetsp:Transcript_58933/g.175344  ORF Transcript_58933/g.175344 Transcript_58933/m.175344 type:complete len:211 (+) Transcript_58933:51-683(+)